MATLSVSTDDASARASDALQAAYFRSALADYRAVLVAKISRQGAKLNAMSGKADPMAISRMRRQMRENEAEHQRLDSMIAAIDRRFSASWASR
ncbi:hypothetical protein [Mycobacterium sp.]|uniref:hypothetical protein n=1 Tax=Mycobacterium sp. TaxID=1785 RepID=UPI002BCB878C|nr:hypothetical protein [Mycobacterium sp.]HKP40540.1 hypothetical protein [Mycobacterium sp.]